MDRSPDHTEHTAAKRTTGAKPREYKPAPSNVIELPEVIEFPAFPEIEPDHFRPADQCSREDFRAAIELAHSRARVHQKTARELIEAMEHFHGEERS